MIKKILLIFTLFGICTSNAMAGECTPNSGWDTRKVRTHDGYIFPDIAEFNKANRRWLANTTTTVYVCGASSGNCQKDDTATLDAGHVFDGKFVNYRATYECDGKNWQEISNEDPIQTLRGQDACLPVEYNNVEINLGPDEEFNNYDKLLSADECKKLEYNHLRVKTSYDSNAYYKLVCKPEDGTKTNTYGNYVNICVPETDQEAKDLAENDWCEVTINSETIRVIEGQYSQNTYTLDQCKKANEHMMLLNVADGYYNSNGLYRVYCKFASYNSNYWRKNASKYWCELVDCTNGYKLNEKKDGCVPDPKYCSEVPDGKGALKDSEARGFYTYEQCNQWQLGFWVGGSATPNARYNIKCSGGKLLCEFVECDEDSVPVDIGHGMKRCDKKKSKDVVNDDDNSLRKCLADKSRKGNPEALACCYLPKNGLNGATWTGKICKCNDTNKTFKIDQNDRGQCVENNEPIVKPIECPKFQHSLDKKTCVCVDTNARLINGQCTCNHLGDAYLNPQGYCQCSSDHQEISNGRCQDTKEWLAEQLKVKISDAFEKLNKKIGTFEKSVWKDTEGGFNMARLASDSVAGVVLGTAGGIITSKIVKKNQLKAGFEDINCAIGGQKVADFGDTMTVGLQ